MRIVYFGTPELSAGILRLMLKEGANVAAVVTQPDRPQKRSAAPVYSPVKEAALEAGIPVLQPEKVSDPEFLDELQEIGADIHVVAAYAQKLPNRLLEMAPLGCINMHPSLLPKYRGASPMAAAILNGDDVAGVSIMKMAEKMDAGDIYLQREIPLSKTETTESLEEKVIPLGAQMLLEVMDGLEKGTAAAAAQDHTQASYIKQFVKTDGLIDFTQDAAVIERKTRGLYPWPGTFTYLEGKVFKIIKAEEGTLITPGEDSSQPGEIIYAEGDTLAVKCGAGLLCPVVVQLEGKKAMPVSDFLRGRKDLKGKRLG